MSKALVVVNIIGDNTSTPEQALLAAVREYTFSKKAGLQIGVTPLEPNKPNYERDGFIITLNPVLERARLYQEQNTQTQIADSETKHAQESKMKEKENALYEGYTNEMLTYLQERGFNVAMFECEEKTLFTTGLATARELTEQLRNK